MGQTIPVADPERGQYADPAAAARGPVHPQEMPATEPPRPRRGCSESSPLTAPTQGGAGPENRRDTGRDSTPAQTRRLGPSIGRESTRGRAEPGPGPPRPDPAARRRASRWGSFFLPGRRPDAGLGVGSVQDVERLPISPGTTAGEAQGVEAPAIDRIGEERLSESARTSRSNRSQSSAVGRTGRSHSGMGPRR
jgi:hypothetical protein